MAKGKNAHLASAGRTRGRGRANGRKGRAANAQTRRGLLETTDDKSTRPESVVSDDVHTLSARTDDGVGKDEDDKEQNTSGPSGSPSPLTSLATDVTITVPVAMWVSFLSTPTLFAPFDPIFYAGFRPLRSAEVLGKKTCSTAHHYRATHRLSISRHSSLVRFFLRFCSLCSLDDICLSSGPRRYRFYHPQTKISLTKAASLSSSVHGHAYPRFPSLKLHLPTNAYVRLPALVLRTP